MYGPKGAVSRERRSFRSQSNNLLRAKLAFHGVAHHAEMIVVMPEFKHRTGLFDTDKPAWIITSDRFNVHSIRKNLLSALYGPAVADGTISMDSSLADLGIDDNEPSLTDVEKRATVRHLITARSGVYHLALYETRAMAAMRSLRGSHPAGRFWHYNNWDGRQIVSADCVKESVKAHSDVGFAGGYGYLWWVAVNGKHMPFVNLPSGAFSARGAGGHYVLVVPAMDMVLVHVVNTDIRGHSVNPRQFGELVRLILEARVSKQ